MTELTKEKLLSDMKQDNRKHLRLYLILWPVFTFAMVFLGELHTAAKGGTPNPMMALLIALVVSAVCELLTLLAFRNDRKTANDDNMHICITEDLIIDMDWESTASHTDPVHSYYVGLSGWCYKNLYGGLKPLEEVYIVDIAGAGAELRKFYDRSCTTLAPDLEPMLKKCDLPPKDDLEAVAERLASFVVGGKSFRKEDGRPLARHYDGKGPSGIPGKTPILCPHCRHKLDIMNGLAQTCPKCGNIYTARLVDAVYKKDWYPDPIGSVPLVRGGK